MTRTRLLKIGLIGIIGLILLGGGLTIYAYRQAVANQAIQPTLPGNNLNPAGNPPQQPGNNQPPNALGPLPTMIIEIIPGSPALAAGLQPGDNILAVDDQAVDPWQMLALLRQKQPGDVLNLRLRRVNQELSLTLTLGDDANAPGRAYFGATILPPPPLQNP